MAIFQETHPREDTAEKRPLTADDIAFLKKLQSRLNTQDTMGNRDPRFWVIRQSVETACPESEADVTQVVDHEACEIVADNLNGLIKHLQESREKGFIEAKPHDDDPEAWSIVINNPMDETFEDGYVTELDELVDLLLQAGETRYALVWSRRTEENVKDTLFLTHEECEDHLRRYGYNYAQDAHAFAMTAVRSPEFERLIGLLQHVNWNALEIE